MRCLALLAMLVFMAPGAGLAQGMLDSKHNLSASGPGPIRAVSEQQICVFCHTPHNASPASPLWNRQLSGSTYTPYASGSLQGAVGQPNGYSRLCLSCHDGTIAIGSVHNLGGRSTTISMQGTAAGGLLPSASAAYLGTDLSNDHPVSFVFNEAVAVADGELISPSALTGRIRLYEGGTAGVRDSVQCTTCHDPHLTENPKFVKKALTGRADNLCLTCHVKPGWSGSSHEAATGKFYPLGSSTSVADLSCVACHHPHAELGAPRLLRAAVPGTGETAPAIERTCYRCHAPTAQGGVSFDVKSQFEKTRRHPIADYSGHEPVFTTATPPESVLNSSKHVECPDCHNPHRVRPRGTAGTGGVHEGMRGIRLDGTVRDDTSAQDDVAQYEICFRCHGDTYASVTGTTVLGDPNGGLLPTGNKREQFQTTNSSYHPVAGPGKNTSTNLNAQLTPKGLSTTSVIQCSDCHNSDYYSGAAFQGVLSQYPANQGQPKGPHGSTRYNLLRAKMWNTLPGPSTWSPGGVAGANFDLCFHCHDLDRLTQRRTDDSPGARTNFYDLGGGKDNLHWVHLVDRIGKSQPICRSCHYNVHSNVNESTTQYRVTATNCSAGAVTTNPTLVPLATTRLISFHPNIQRLGTRTKPEWCFNTATRQRRCYLVCHQPNGNAGGTTMNGDDKARYTPPAAGDIQ